MFKILSNFVMIITTWKRSKLRIENFEMKILTSFYSLIFITKTEYYFWKDLSGVWT